MRAATALTAVTAVTLAALVVAACRDPRQASPRAQAYLDRARSLAARAQLPEAIAEAEKAVKVDPRSAPPKALLGSLWREAGRSTGAGSDDRNGYYRRAREALEAAIALDPAAAAPRIDLALLLADAQRQREAIALLEPVAGPAEPEACFQLGALLAGLGDYAAARRAYELGLGARPADADAHRAYGIALLRSGEPARARAELLQAVRLKPGSPDSWHQLGSLLATIEPGEAARLALGRAIELRPQSEESVYALAQLLRRLDREPEAATWEARLEALRQERARVQEMEEQAARVPGDLGLRLALGQAYLARGAPIRALGAARAVLAERPTDAAARCLLAEAYRQLGARSSARIEVATLLAASPDDGCALELRGRMAFEEGRREEAEADLKRADRWGTPGFALEGFVRLGFSGNPERAIYCGTAWPSDPSDDASTGFAITSCTDLEKVCARGYALMRKPDGERALERCLDLRPGDPEVVAWLLEARLQAGAAAAEIERLKAHLQFLIGASGPLAAVGDAPATTPPATLPTPAPSSSTTLRPSPETTP